MNEPIKMTASQGIKLGFWFSFGVTLYMCTLPLAILIATGGIYAIIGWMAGAR